MSHPVLWGAWRQGGKGGTGISPGEQRGPPGTLAPKPSPCFSGGKEGGRALVDNAHGRGSADSELCSRPALS